MQKRFGVLRFIGGFYKVVGIIVAVLTILSSIGMCATSVLGTTLLGGALQQFSNGSGIPMMVGGGVVAGIIGGLFIILFGAIVALALYALGELIFLLIAVEENTRAGAIRQ